MVTKLFSITAHESADCIIDLIKNIDFFNPNSKFVIHINKQSDSVYFEFLELVKLLDSNLSERVFVTKDRVSSSKTDYNLDIAHRKNLDHINKMDDIGFDYFIMQASNCLYIRHGMEEYIKDKDIGIKFSYASGIWKEAIENHNCLNIFIRAHLGDTSPQKLKLKGAHEGVFISKTLVYRIFDIVKNIRELCVYLQDPPSYPTEEVWFVLAFLILSKDTKLTVGNTVTYMPWERSLDWSLEQVKDAMDKRSGIPMDKYAIKRVERNINNPIRIYIRDFSGY